MADPKSRLSGIVDREFDLIVVGGGITGCGIALEASLRGLRVVLAEQDDFASGTSSRSSRLIHGGVRYLEHGHLRLVFEASAERRRLLALAGHLVRPLRFTWPVYRGARVPLWKLAAGLTLYDMLSLFRNVGRHRRLSASKVRAREPRLRVDGLTGGATYFDASTDDARLTLAVALEARSRGAVLLNHTRAEQLVVENGRARGVVLRDQISGETAAARAAVIINATGPWSDDFRRQEDAQITARVQGSKGVHIAVPHGRVGDHGALTLLSPDDGRVMFILPGKGLTIIGTTDTFTSASPNEVRASEADVSYLLAAANHFFPDAKLVRNDVVAAWAGIRPLAASRAGDSVSASREHVVTITPAGVVTITGGKLTTYRVMAAQTVDAALRSIKRAAPPSRSEETPIAWDPSMTVESAIADATRTTNDRGLATHLVSTYGNAWPNVWATIERTADGRTLVDPSQPHFRGEITYACETELARTFGDLLIRRFGLAFRMRDNGRAAARRIGPHMARALGWSDAQVTGQLEAYDREVDRIFRVDP